MAWNQLESRTVFKVYFLRRIVVESSRPGCSAVASSRPPCLLLLFSRCSLRRLFSSGLPWPRLHLLTLHFFLWMVSGHGSPPNWGSSFTTRVRIMWPLPQDLLHSDHSVHSVTRQSVAEGGSEHFPACFLLTCYLSVVLILNNVFNGL